MKPILPTILSKLNCAAPLYAVGGCVRNALLGVPQSADVDLAADLSTEEVKESVLRVGGVVKGEYPRTQTLLFLDGENSVTMEFTSFRRERYAEGGGHAPVAVERTHSLCEDALRRDFSCNAVYYDISREEWVDPLGGMEAIKNRLLIGCRAPEKVFSSDGLRLLRLCRFAAELNFSPSPDTVAGARRYARNIRDIAAERIYAELLKILAAPEKYPFSLSTGAEDGLRLSETIGVFGELFPELAAGRGMAQRSDFHDYDVLAHSFRAVRYATPRVRLAALLHDVGKPICYRETGRFYEHAERGAVIAEAILKRLKAPIDAQKRVAKLTLLHMLDLDGKMREAKIKRVIRDNASLFESLMELKQADFSACKDCLSVAPAVARWSDIYKRMKEAGVPFSLHELQIDGRDLTEIGYCGSAVGKELLRLWDFTLEYPNKNQKKSLLERAKEDLCR